MGLSQSCMIYDLFSQNEREIAQSISKLRPDSYFHTVSFMIYYVLGVLSYLGSKTQNFYRELFCFFYFLLPFDMFNEPHDISCSHYMKL